MDNQEILKICTQKHNKTINATWDELAKKLDYKSGEALRSWYKKYRRSNGQLPSCNKTSILHISDLHCPFNLPKEVLKDYVNKIDILVFNGDIQDCQGISKFRKKYRVPFVDEMILTRQLMTDIVEYIKPKKVLVNYGNHECRVISYFSDKLHEDLLQLMPETSMDFICDLGFWKHDHQNKTKTFYEPLNNMFKNIEFKYTKNWWCKIGQTIFAHPKAYVSKILGTTEKAYLHFLQSGESFDTMVLAHTHKQAFSRYGTAYLFESGSLCEEQEYAMNGGMGRPQDQGFIYLVQDENGNLVYKDCKIECL